MLRKIRPNLRNRLDLPFKFVSALTVPCSVIWRQRVHRCDSGMQRPCSAGFTPVFAIRGDAVGCVQIDGWFDSRRLHFEVHKLLLSRHGQERHVNSEPRKQMPTLEKRSSLAWCIPSA
jgi:hypothetical protein